MKLDSKLINNPLPLLRESRGSTFKYSEGEFSAPFTMFNKVPNVAGLNVLVKLLHPASINECTKKCEKPRKM